MNLKHVITGKYFIDSFNIFGIRQVVFDGVDPPPRTCLPAGLKVQGKGWGLLAGVSGVSHHKGGAGAGLRHKGLDKAPGVGLCLVVLFNLFIVEPKNLGDIACVLLRCGDLVLMFVSYWSACITTLISFLNSY